jgi:hypothetical protein
MKKRPILLAREARPDFGDTPSVVSLNNVEIVPRFQAQLSAR